MKIISIEFENFRQLYGKNKISFSLDSNQNVTVIHGENGSGKTTLLNAFKWCFYGTTDFDTKAENLLNERAIDEVMPASTIDMSVKVEFEHEDLKYSATRKAFFKKLEGLEYDPIGGEVFDLDWIDAHGKSISSKNPSTHINQILPEKMHSYFFFNGERIEKLAHLNAADQIKNAIKNLMGVEIVERASQHLGGPVITKLRKDLKAASSDELSVVIERETDLTNLVKTLNDSIALNDKNLSQLQEELQQVNKAIEQNSEVSSLQKDRSKLEDSIEEARSKLAQIKKERHDLISMYGFLAFSDSLIQESESILEEKRKKGELPFKIKEQFINDLLDKKTCICERPLEPGSTPFNAVQSFKKSTTTDDVESAFMNTSSNIPHMKLSRNNLHDQLSKFQHDESNLVTSIRKMEGEIDILSSQIGSGASADVASLEIKRGKCQSLIGEAFQTKGSLETQYKEMSSKLDSCKKDREKLDAKTQQGALAKRRLEHAEEAKKIIDRLYSALSDQVREKLSEKVNTTFKAIVRKQYWAEISKDYILQIYKTVGETKQLVYEKSTGENQVTSLSFVGSIISLAKERQQSATSYFKGGVFPLVMDSPFGALDSDYREEVADYIPQLAEQVIIMASDSQWHGTVENKIKPRVGKEYSLLYFTPHPKDNKESALVVQSEKYEYSEIKEGNYGK